MNEEALGWLYAMAALGLFLYLAYEGFIVKRHETIDQFKRAPFSSLINLCALLGAFMFLGYLVSFGKLSFVIETPIINIHSALLGLALCLLPIFNKWK